MSVVAIAAIGKLLKTIRGVIKRQCKWSILAIRNC